MKKKLPQTPGYDLWLAMYTKDVLRRLASTRDAPIQRARAIIRERLRIMDEWKKKVKALKGAQDKRRDR